MASPILSWVCISMCSSSLHHNIYEQYEFLPSTGRTLSFTFHFLLVHAPALGRNLHWYVLKAVRYSAENYNPLEKISS